LEKPKKLTNFRYEMLVGLPPFYHKDSSTMYSFILQKKVFWPDQIPISDDGKDFIEKLLRKAPNERLGAGAKGYRELFEHAWL